MDYAEILEETPSFTLFKMFVRQFLCVRSFFFIPIGLVLNAPDVSQWLSTLLVVSADEQRLPGTQHFSIRHNRKGNPRYPPYTSVRRYSEMFALDLKDSHVTLPRSITSQLLNYFTLRIVRISFLK